MKRSALPLVRWRSLIVFVGKPKAERTMADKRHPYSKPDQQGKFDGLCAVYSILNSIKLLYRFSEDDLDAMFRSLCESLPDKFPRALWDGLGVPEIRRMLNFSVTYLAKHHRYD